MQQRTAVGRAALTGNHCASYRSKCGSHFPVHEQYESMRAAMSFDGWVLRQFVSRFAPGDPEIAFVDFGSTIPLQPSHESDYPGYQGISYLSGGLNVDLPTLTLAKKPTSRALRTTSTNTLLPETTPVLTTVDNPDVVPIRQHSTQQRRSLMSVRLTSRICLIIWMTDKEIGAIKAWLADAGTAAGGAYPPNWTDWLM